MITIIILSNLPLLILVIVKAIRNSLKEYVEGKIVATRIETTSSIVYFSVQVPKTGKVYEVPVSKHIYANYKVGDKFTILV
jgi:hypothetical protein